MARIVILGNGNDWCELSLSSVANLDNVKVINAPLPYDLKHFLSKICKLHYSQTIEKHFEMPLKSAWFGYFANYICHDRNAELIVLIYDRHRLANNTAFLTYLRKHFANIKLIYLFTNIIKISGAILNDYVGELNKYYDRVYAFDPSDAPRYGFYYHPLLYSDNHDSTIREKQSVFYVGRAKDRYDMLIRSFERIAELGIERKFFIFGVPEDKQRHREEIIYNKMIPYIDCLKYIQESSCLIDVIQGESEGFTIKVCEAVFYNKLLITTNEEIKKAPFYNPKWILVMNNPVDITVEFLSHADDVSYSQEDRDYFSAETFLTHLEKELF